ncbi:hypothetical protein U1Q18_008571 [Sarracenia purpurea var. burkii]
MMHINSGAVVKCYGYQFVVDVVYLDPILQDAIPYFVGHPTIWSVGKVLGTVIGAPRCFVMAAILLERSSNNQIKCLISLPNTQTA